MMNPYGSLCDDFGVYVYLNTKMELPTKRETVLHFFDSIQMTFPKMTGKMMSETLGKISFWLMFFGFNIAFFPQHILGLLGMPRRIYTYEAGLGWEVGNLISTIGAFILALGVLFTVIAFIRSRRGALAGPDPWDGETLEWASTSPPPAYNFAAIPQVRSKEPMWDQPELREDDRAPALGLELAEGHQVLITSVLDAKPQAIAHMPHASPWPFTLTVALMVLAYGVLLDAWLLAGVGAAGTLVGITGWFWPRGETQES